MWRTCVKRCPVCRTPFPRLTPSHPPVPDNQQVTLNRSALSSSPTRCRQTHQRAGPSPPRGARACRGYRVHSVSNAPPCVFFTWPSKAYRRYTLRHVSVTGYPPHTHTPPGLYTVYERPSGKGHVRSPPILIVIKLSVKLAGTRAHDTSGVDLNNKSIVD